MRPCLALSRSYNHQPQPRPRPLPHRQNFKHPSRTIRMGNNSNSSTAQVVAPQPLWPEPLQLTLRPYQRFLPPCTPLPRILIIRATKALKGRKGMPQIRSRMQLWVAAGGHHLSQPLARVPTAAGAAAATRARRQLPSTRQSAPQAEEVLLQRLSSRHHRRCKHHCARNSSDFSVVKALTHPLRRHSRIRYLTRSTLL